MSEEFSRFRPLVVLELPLLTRGEDADDARPVFGLELLGTVYNDKTNWTSCVDGRDDTGDVEDRRGGGGCGEGGVWWDVSALLKEGLDVGHAQQRGCGWRNEDDWIWATGWLCNDWHPAVEGAWLGFWITVLGLDELSCQFADV